jgi:hypothetical protein
MVYSKPIYVFRKLVNYLSKYQIILPGYRLMQDIVSQALTSEQNRLINIINSQLQSDRVSGQVLKLMTDESIPADTPFKTFQSNAFGILPRQKLITVADRMAKAVSFDEIAFQCVAGDPRRWEYIDKLSRQFKLHLRQLIMAVEFTTKSSQDTLIEAVDFLKAAFKKGKPLKEFQSDLFPVECVPISVSSYLYT